MLKILKMPIQSEIIGNNGYEKNNHIYSNTKQIQQGLSFYTIYVYTVYSWHNINTF